MKLEKSYPLGGIETIKNSVAAISPTMQLAKETAADKYEQFDKIVLSSDGEPFLGASNQPTPDPIKFELDETLFGNVSSNKKKA